MIRQPVMMPNFAEEGNLRFLREEYLKASGPHGEPRSQLAAAVR
jgi:hypothetical protein